MLKRCTSEDVCFRIIARELDLQFVLEGMLSVR